jgi:hypothetical protein
VVNLSHVGYSGSAQQASRFKPLRRGNGTVGGLDHTQTFTDELQAYCSRRSRRGLVQEDKRMAFVYTHGLFIT